MGKSKEQLFETFSANLGFYFKDFEGRFACPLCLRVFSREQISELSKAHIVAEGLGGTEYTLACRKCNNYIGGQIEGVEIEHARTVKSLCGKSKEPVKAHFEVHDSKGVAGLISANVLIKDQDCSNIHFDFRREASNPAEMQSVINWFTRKTSSKSSNWNFRFTVKVCRDQHRANLTYLHAAYMLLFHNFGYEWIAEPSAETIRQQLFNPREKLLDVKFLHWRKKAGDPEQLSLHMAVNPPELKGFFIAFPEFEHLPKRRAIWMPAFGDAYAPPDDKEGVLDLKALPDFYDSLCDRDAKWRGFQLCNYMYA